MNGIFDTKNDAFMWVGAGQHHRTIKSKADVSLHIVSNNKKDAIALTFRNGIHKLITETDYILVSMPKKNRIYFKQGTQMNGLLLGKNKGTLVDNRYSRFYAEEDVKFFLDFHGEYELKHDDFNELYYIEKEESNDKD